LNTHSQIEHGHGTPGQDPGPPPTRKAGLPRTWLAILGLVVLAAIAVGYGLYRHEASGIREEKIDDLKSIAKLKVGQITQWRKERIGDARVISSSPFNRSAVAQWIAAPENEDLKDGILGRMELFWKSYGYADVILAGLDGRLLLSVGSATPPFDPYSKNLIAQAVSSHGIVFGDLSRNTSDNRVYLDVMAPILDFEGRPAAVMILRTDPEQYLYPLIQFWPTSSQSAETLLVRKEGDQVLFLNRIRHRPEPALTLRFPMSQTDLPAAQAVLGREGYFEGRDYRGVKVVSHLSALPGAPWFMVSKVDAGEIFAEARSLGLAILLFLALFIILTVVFAVFVFNYRQRNLYAALYESEKERRESEEISRVTLYSIGDGVIGTDIQGRVRQMNPVAERLTGWTEAEALGKNIGEVFRIVNEDTRAEVENPIVRVLREGVVIGLANHTLLLAKSGAEYPIADAGAPIRTEQGETSGVVLVFRDQTMERKAEKALRESERKFRETVLHLDEGYYSCTMDGLLLEHNLAFNRILGFSPEEDLKGAKLPDFWQNPEDRKDYLNELMAKGIVRNYLIQAKTIGGDKIVIMANSHLVKDEQGRPMRIEGTYTDFTERKRAEEALRIRNKIAEIFLIIPDYEMYTEVLKIILESMNSKYGVFGYIDENGALVVPTMTRTVWEQCQVDDKDVVFPRKTWGDGTWPCCIREKKTFVLNELSSRTPKGHIPIDRHISSPLIHQGEVVGLLQVANKETNYSAEDIALLETIGRVIAPVLDARLRRERQEAARKRAEDALRQSEEELRRHRDELEVLVKERSEQLYLSEQRLAQESAAVTEIISEMLNGQLSDEETERQVLNACLDATGSVYGMIGRVNEHEKYDVTTYSSRSLSDCAFPEALAWELSTGMEIRGIWGWPLLNGEPLVCNDLEHHPDRVGLPEGHLPLGSFLGVPVKHEGRVTGLVAVANRPGGYTEADVGTLTRLVDVMVVSRRHRQLLAEAQAAGAELEQRVSERTAQLETANKELEAFAYSVSHDLRAPLRGLDGFSAALLSQYTEKLDEQGRHYLERIQAASRRMGQLIDDLLNLSRLSRRELIRREVDLSALARQIAAELQARDPERLAEFTIAEGMTCEGDAHLLRVALGNLMGNAWKFTGGRSPAQIEVGTAEQDGERVYFVRDNGVGFDMAYADKLFTPFQRLHAVDEFPGTGIGLATVQRILQRHGGRIWPEAAVGRGATFSFTLGGEHDGQNHPAG